MRSTRTEYNRKYYIENRDRILENRKKYDKEYRDTNKERISLSRKVQYQNDKDKVLNRGKNQREEFKLEFLGLKKRLGCKECGTKDVRLLEFHHRDPSTKLFTIGNSSTRRKTLLEEEIKKCDLLCANCHKIAQWDHKYRGIL